MQSKSLGKLDTIGPLFPWRKDIKLEFLIFTLLNALLANQEKKKFFKFLKKVVKSFKDKIQQC